MSYNAKHLDYQLGAIFESLTMAKGYTGQGDPLPSSVVIDLRDRTKDLLVTLEIMEPEKRTAYPKWVGKEI